MLGNLKAGVVGFSSAFIASLCCLLPLTIVLLGLGSGAFMMVTMQYRSIFLPIGVAGVGLGYFFYFRELRRCQAAGCAFAGRKLNLSLLGLATLMLLAEVALATFPEITARFLQRLM